MKKLLGTVLLIMAMMGCGAKDKATQGLVGGEENKGKKLLFIKDISNVGNKSIARGLFDSTSSYPDIIKSVVNEFNNYVGRDVEDDVYFVFDEKGNILEIVQKDENYSNESAYEYKSAYVYKLKFDIREDGIPALLSTYPKRYINRDLAFTLSPQQYVGIYDKIRTYTNGELVDKEIIKSYGEDNVEDDNAYESESVLTFDKDRLVQRKMKGTIEGKYFYDSKGRIDYITNAYNNYIEFEDQIRIASSFTKNGNSFTAKPENIIKIDYDNDKAILYKDSNMNEIIGEQDLAIDYEFYPSGAIKTIQFNHTNLNMSTEEGIINYDEKGIIKSYIRKRGDLITREITQSYLVGVNGIESFERIESQQSDVSSPKYTDTIKFKYYRTDSTIDKVDVTFKMDDVDFKGSFIPKK